MPESTSGSEMVFRTIRCFTDDGVLDADELDQIVAIALADGILDERERRILKSIICNLTAKDLTPELCRRVEQLIERFGLDEAD